MSARIIQLDALRGIAAFLVACFHYTTKYQELYGHPSALANEISWGHYGVQLFFVISGFVIFMTLERTKDWRDFIVSRFARLYPAYWFSVLLTFSVLCLVPLPGRTTTLLKAIVNFTMLQEWLGIQHVDGVYWTLTLELSFYTIMLMLFLLRQMKHMLHIAFAWLSAMVLVWGGEKGICVTFPVIVKTSLLLDYANIFIAGIVLYAIYKKGATRFMCVMLAFSIAVELILHGLESSMVLSGIVMLVYATVVKNVEYLTGFLSLRPVVFLGAISYSFYLIHQNIGYVVLRVLYARGVSSNCAIFSAFCVSVLLAYMTNIIVERPGRDRIRSWWFDNKTRVASVVPEAS